MTSTETQPRAISGVTPHSASRLDSPAPIDRPGWRQFLLALAGLALAFFLALYATALREAGRSEFAAVTALASLVLAGAVAIKAVPYLARRARLERLAIKLDYGFTREGLVYLLVVVVIIVAALNTGNNLLFMILASLLAGILASGVLSAIVLTGIELEFALPERVFAGQPVSSRLTVYNRKRLLPSFSITISARAGTNDGPRAKPLPNAPQNLLARPVYFAHLPHRAALVEHIELTFPRRGRYTQDGFRAGTKFPFGLVRKSREIAARHEMLVLPSIEPTDEFYEVLPLISGEVESFHKGRGHDLYAIRDYREGDSARHVDWKATAKARALKVREFAREDERRVALVFDTEMSEGEQSPVRFEKAVAFCACLAWHYYEIGAQMQFVSPEFETPMASAAEIVYPALERLAVIEPSFDSESRVAGSFLAQVAARVPGFRVVLTSRPRGSIPTPLWESSYLVFSDSL